MIHFFFTSIPINCQQHITLHTTAGLLLQLSRVGPGQSLDGRPDAAGSGVGGPVGGTLSSGLKKDIPMSQGSDWGHCVGCCLSDGTLNECPDSLWSLKIPNLSLVWLPNHP